MWDREQKHGVKLYVRRVFIMDEADKLMPHYLRFVKGVVDSDDLPLNVSREILQHDKKIDSIRSANVKRVLGLLEKLAKDEPEKYQAFWKEFGKGTQRRDRRRTSPTVKDRRPAALRLDQIGQ